MRTHIEKPSASASGSRNGKGANRVRCDSGGGAELESAKPRFFFGGAALAGCFDFCGMS